MSDVSETAEFALQKVKKVVHIEKKILRKEHKFLEALLDAQRVVNHVRIYDPVWSETQKILNQYLKNIKDNLEAQGLSDVRFIKEARAEAKRMTRFEKEDDWESVRQYIAVLEKNTDEHTHLTAEQLGRISSTIGAWANHLETDIKRLRRSTALQRTLQFDKGIRHVQKIHKLLHVYAHIFDKLSAKEKIIANH